MLQSNHLPSPGPLSSEPAEMQGPMIKCNLGLQTGTAFAQRGPDKGPRPQRSRAWPLPLSKSKASPYRENGVCEDAAARAVLRCPCLRYGGGGASRLRSKGGRRHGQGLTLRAGNLYETPLPAAHYTLM